MNNIPVETERKFLIKYPENILSEENVTTTEMVQTYLLSEKGITDRVRKMERDGKTCYVRTCKRRISSLSSFEEENEIDYAEYEKLLLNADPSLTPIVKTRYSFPFNGHIIEIDVYPFWNDRAILEIELESENEEYDIPSFITVIKEVTDDNRYKNVNLAKHIPVDEI